jgi:hypothetical protein
LLYGSEIWGGSLVYKNKLHCFDNWFKDEIEKCHIKFCRFLIGVHRRTPIIAIHGETGRFPLLLEVKRNIVKYWLRLKELPSDNLLNKAYIANIILSPTKNWSIAVEDILKDAKIYDITLHVSSMIAKKVLLNLQDLYIEYWKLKLSDDIRQGSGGNKLRTYRTFKQSFRQEDYLTDVVNKLHRRDLTRLRLSSHTLHIETGRYTSGRRVEAKDRLCQYCDMRECEDEIHFIMRCDLYKDMRTNLFASVGHKYHHFHTYTEADKFIWLMSNVDKSISNLLAKYVSDCFQQRKVTNIV